MLRYNMRKTNHLLHILCRTEIVKYKLTVILLKTPKVQVMTYQMYRIFKTHADVIETFVIQHSTLVLEMHLCTV